MPKRIWIPGLVIAGLIAAFLAFRPAAPLRLALREWHVVSMTGFATDPPGGASFRFVGDDIRLDDTVNEMNFRIAWDDSGFIVRRMLVSTDVAQLGGGSTFADLFEAGEHVDVHLDHGRLTLARDGIAAIARS